MPAQFTMVARCGLQEFLVGRCKRFVFAPDTMGVGWRADQRAGAVYNGFEMWGTRVSGRGMQAVCFCSGHNGGGLASRTNVPVQFIMVSRCGRQEFLVGMQAVCFWSGHTGCGIGEPTIGVGAVYCGFEMWAQEFRLGDSSGCFFVPGTMR